MCPEDGPMDEATEQARQRWDVNARGYDRAMRVFEWLLFGDGRAWVCSQARGDVLEIAVGTGRNLAYYPLSIRLTGIELSPKMLDVARQRLRELDREADLRVGDAQALDFPDASFDTVVCTLSLCSIPDDGRAVAEARRVLRPGGRLLLLEHVRSPSAAVQAVQRLLEPLFSRDGDTLLREPLDHLVAEGFEIERLERAKWGIVERVVGRKSPGSWAPAAR
jgi:ubiquinone/menaquinone biosynthesis C-methylase UbiE